jgi:hypothetical protein
MTSRIRIVLSLAPALFSACSTLAIKEVDFGWPVESVLTVSEENRVEDRRYSILFDVTPLAFAEFQDSSALRGKELRLLRSSQGWYFMTSRGFKNVYVFGQRASELSLESVIQVSRSGLENPALNQRPPYVELVDNGKLQVFLTIDGKVEDENE